MNSIDLFTMRRSRYVLENKLPISDKELETLIGKVLAQAPSAFNVQSARVVLLLGEKHKALWQITRKALRAIVPADKFAPTDEKIKSFEAAHGTILYFDDTLATRALQEQYPAYAENFPVWAQQANGMLQFAVWTALAEAGIGASLQHYNPLIDEVVKTKFSLPNSWQLIAQMPFGTAVGKDLEKTYLPLSERLRIEK
jgi:hypothetical protein